MVQGAAGHGQVNPGHAKAQNIETKEVLSQIRDLIADMHDMTHESQIGSSVGQQNKTTQKSQSEALQQAKEPDAAP